MGMYDEIDDFKIYKDYITEFIVRDSKLLKLIYFPVQAPYQENELENPYEVFNEDSALDGSNNGVHGVVLFKSKNDDILNASMPILLINHHTTTPINGYWFEQLYIVFTIICKGSYAQTLEDGSDRCKAIARRIQDNMNMARINNVSEVKQVSFTPISLNEENSGYSITFRMKAPINNLSTNVNYNKRRYGVDLLT